MIEFGLDGSFNYSGKALENCPSGAMTGQWFIVLEYISRGTFVDLMHQSGKLTEPVAKYFFEQMVDAIAYLNEKGVAHRDLKLDNMLVNGAYQVKISDFSFASNEAVTPGDIRGTPNYIAPEILEKTATNGMISDVFSVGVILFCCLTNKFPFKLARASDARYKLIIEKDYKAFWEAVKIGEGDLTEEARDLIHALIEHEPEKRIKLADIKKHEWFEAADQLSEEVVDANYLAK